MTYELIYLKHTSYKDAVAKITLLLSYSQGKLLNEEKTSGHRTSLYEFLALSYGFRKSPKIA